MAATDGAACRFSDCNLIDPSHLFTRFPKNRSTADDAIVSGVRFTTFGRRMFRPSASRCSRACFHHRHCPHPWMLATGLTLHARKIIGSLALFDLSSIAMPCVLTKGMKLTRTCAWI